MSMPVRVILVTAASLLIGGSSCYLLSSPLHDRVVDTHQAQLLPFRGPVPVPAKITAQPRFVPDKFAG
jgi:hypothetical protein